MKSWFVALVFSALSIPTAVAAQAWTAHIVAGSGPHNERSGSVYYRDAVSAALDASVNAISLSVAPNRPGTYAVEVRRSGYKTWTRSGVRVTDGKCAVETVTFTARLELL